MVDGSILPLWGSSLRYVNAQVMLLDGMVSGQWHSRKFIGTVNVIYI